MFVFYDICKFFCYSTFIQSSFFSSFIFTMTNCLDNKLLKSAMIREWTFLKIIENASWNYWKYVVKDHKLLFNIIHHPNLSSLKDIISRDQEHQKLFVKVPFIGFRRAFFQASLPHLRELRIFVSHAKNQDARSLITLLVLMILN